MVLDKLFQPLWQSDQCDQLLNNFDKGLTTCCVFPDLVKAFNTVNHNILTAKLSHFGIVGAPLQLIRSNLKFSCR